MSRGKLFVGAGVNRRLALATFLLLIGGSSLFAATITVRSGADAGGTCPGATCTFRQAIATTAVTGDPINFASGITMVTLISAEQSINKNLTISGRGAPLRSEKVHYIL